MIRNKAMLCINIQENTRITKDIGRIGLMHVDQTMHSNIFTNSTQCEGNQWNEIDVSNSSIIIMPRWE